MCNVDLPTTKSSNSVAITLNVKDVNIFTSKPSSPLGDGYYYHKGDLWVVGGDYQPSGYSQNTILVTNVDATSYSDSHWVESVDFNKALADVNSWKGVMQEHVKIDNEGLHLIGSVSGGKYFESLLQSQQLTFRSVSGDTRQDVVWLGTNDMTAKNVTALNYLKVQSESGSLPYIQLGNFILQVEDNGSFSIM